MKLEIGELDVFYLSYDEPNKEEHWADIISKFPFAKRVDGVKGFDNAHKECARQSDTDRFITVDGDNIVEEPFFDIELTFPEGTDLANSVVSWSAKNMTNGLVENTVVAVVLRIADYQKLNVFQSIRSF